MKILSLVQGSEEWIKVRKNYRTASEASAMMGVSKYQSRSELLAIKAGGAEKEIDNFTQALFDRGHETEALARILAEEIIGEELSPATVVDGYGYLLASLDGMTITGDVIWEHKLASADLIADVKAGICPERHYWQVAQALYITSAEKCLFMVSDGTKENCHFMWVKAIEKDGERLMAGWRQFDADLAAYSHQEPAAEVIGRAPDDLPALHIEVTGMVTASNLDAFKANALAVFAGINRELSTDSDFADAEKTVKWCAGIEDKLKAAKEHALSQTQSIDLLFKTIDGISAEARATRLELEKLVKARKDHVRIEIQQKAQQKLADHMTTLDKRLGGKVRMPLVVADFAGAMKGKKTITSLQDAVDTELARVKIESSTIADKIDINLGSLRELGANHAFLFSDAQQLVMKANDDLVLLIKSRIAEHETAEAARIDAEVERKLKAEREAKAAEDRRLQAEAERAAEAKQKAEQSANAPTPVVESAAPAIVAPAAAPEVAADPAAVAGIKREPSAPKRPTNEEILILVSNHFGVCESIAYDWLVAGFSKKEAA